MGPGGGHKIIGMESSSTPSDPVGNSNRMVLIILGSLVAVIVLGLIIFFATRTSPEQKALEAVCGARANIETRVNNISQTTIENFTLDAFKEDIEGIRRDVQTISENEEKVKPDRRKNLETANAAFKNELLTTLKTLGTSLSLKNAEIKLTNAAEQLVESYRENLEPIDCTGVNISK